MKKLVFKLITSFFTALTFVSPSKAQKLKFLIPDGVLAQHAGSIGYFSGGITYDLFKNKRGNLDILYGFVPANKGGAFSTLSTKFSYQPFEIKINKSIALYPVNPGAFLNYMISNDFNLTWPDGQYPRSYYYWSEALRAHLFFSNEIRFKLNQNNKNSIRNLSLYYEINTNDAYLVNFFQNNNTISIGEIFKSGFGLRVKF
jgi:hypothetical protein